MKAGCGANHMTSVLYLPSPMFHLYGSVVFILACVAVGEVTEGLRTALQYLDSGTQLKECSLLPLFAPA